MNHIHVLSSFRHVRHTTGGGGPPTPAPPLAPPPMTNEAMPARPEPREAPPARAHPPRTDDAMMDNPELSEAPPTRLGFPSLLSSLGKNVVAALKATIASGVRSLFGGW